MSDAPERIWLDRETGHWCEVPRGQSIEGAVRFLRADLVPQAPEPDWSQAPDWAQWWAVDSVCEAIWWERKPYVVDSGWGSNFGEWSVDRDVDLPLGIDWRTTLRKRPQESDE